MAHRNRTVHKNRKTLSLSLALSLSRSHTPNTHEQMVNQGSYMAVKQTCFLCPPTQRSASIRLQPTGKVWLKPAMYFHTVHDYKPHLTKPLH